MSEVLEEEPYSDDRNLLTSQHRTSTEQINTSDLEIDSNAETAQLENRQSNASTRKPESPL